LCFKREHLWVLNYVRRAFINVCPYFPRLMPDLVTLRRRNLHMNNPTHKPVQTCTRTFSILHMNPFNPAHEPVQSCTWTRSILHVNPFNPAHEHVQSCTWTRSILHMNPFNPAHEPARTFVSSVNISTEKTILLLRA
jgi:hypothetical protein